MIGFVALRADGEVGYASTIPGFRVALSRQGREICPDLEGGGAARDAEALRQTSLSLHSEASTARFVLGA